MKAYIFQDFDVNRKNFKFQLVLVLFRLAQLARRSPLYIVFVPYLVFYRLFVEWLLCCEIPWGVHAGRNLTIYHGQGLVVNDGVIIGENCTLRHNTTIGNKEVGGVYSEAPVLGNNVDVGANVVIIGPVIVGDNVVIGAGSVVVKSIKGDSVVAGNPCRYLNLSKTG